MKAYKTSSYVKRTQKDYSLSFKLGVVQEIERGELSDRETKRILVKGGVLQLTTFKRKMSHFGA